MFEFLVLHWPALALILAGFAWMLWFDARQSSQVLEPQDAVLIVNQQQGVFVDIRDADAFELGHVPGAVHAKADWIEKIPANYAKRPWVVYGNDDRSVSKWLAQGIQVDQVWRLKGGLQGWKDAGFPLELN